MASSPLDNNYIFLIGKIDLEPFFLVKQILEHQVKYDDLAIVKLPEAEMDMDFDQVSIVIRFDVKRCNKSFQKYRAV